MKRKKSYKNYLFTYIKSTVVALVLCLFFVKGYTPLEQTGDNFFYVKVNGQYVGSVSDEKTAEDLLREARRRVALQSGGLTYMNVEMTVEGKEVLWGQVDSESAVSERMEAVLGVSKVSTLQQAYTVKLNDKVVNLAGLDEVREFLQTAIDKYDSEGKFRVDLEYDRNREFSVLNVVVNDSKIVKPVISTDTDKAGIAAFWASVKTEEEEVKEQDFEDYQSGILSMNFVEKIEVVESYLPADRLISVEEAVAAFVADQEVPQIYKVVSGDTLSEIAIKVNIPMDKIIEMNDALADERSVLHIGQELIITVPEPELSVTRVEQSYIEEIYDEDVQIIEVDTWYTNQSEIIQQPSAGFRKIIADICYVNDKAVSKTILKEEVVMEAVPKIIKRGTKIPPTYVKPISGGRLTSSFGPRKQPKPGASTNHKGIDWAVPTGTAVYASCGGTVAKAGWGSGYGYVIYIDHEDGKQTRYGHLSKCLVSVGDKVKQGDKIALSGNTGVSTGPHLHFEILVNGTKVDPLKYVSK
ncbi:MAG: M23 family metallopeptidase [Acetatifactor sp.]|nr:M23 family metallopeptidase [Acetatifactor sp.]